MNIDNLLIKLSEIILARESNIEISKACDDALKVNPLFDHRPKPYSPTLKDKIYTVTKQYIPDEYLTQAKQNLLELRQRPQQVSYNL